jgi:adenylyltransferase/sulfurtransferase
MDVPLEIDVTEAARLLKTPGQAVLLDVREPYELKFCQVKGSLNIPIAQIPGRLAELPRQKHILAFCHHGGRSLRVTEYLRANDYQLVSNVAGGINAWAETIEPGMKRY